MSFRAFAAICLCKLLRALSRVLRRGGSRGEEQQEGRQQEYHPYPTHTVTQLFRTSTKPG